MLACLGRGAVVVAFQQPLAVVGDGELADGGAELLEGGEALEPEDLFLEGLDELLRATVGFWLVVVGRGAGDAEVCSRSVIAPTGPGRRRGGSEVPRRRRASHAAERDTPAIRHATSRGADSCSLTSSASATEGGRSCPAGP